MAEGLARMFCEVFPFSARRRLSPPSTPPSHYYLFWEGRGGELRYEKRENAVTYANIFIGFYRSGRPANMGPATLRPLIRGERFKARLFLGRQVTSSHDGRDL